MCLKTSQAVPLAALKLYLFMTHELHAIASKRGRDGFPLDSQPQKIRQSHQSLTGTPKLARYELGQSRLLLRSEQDRCGSQPLPGNKNTRLRGEA